MNYRCLVAVLLLAAVFSPVMAVTFWDYQTAGTYVWTCPANVTKIYVSFIGSGSSGHGGWRELGVAKPGYGGNAGQLVNVSGIAVVPGTNYTLHVGAGGAQDAATDTSNVLAQAGSVTYATFGLYYYSASGGAAVYGKTSVSGNGGNGTTGHYSDSLSAGGGWDGEDVAGYTGGTGGFGAGAGGGGGAANATSDQTGYGGSGEAGAIFIWTQETSDGNFPAFHADSTNLTAGEAVHFFDDSVIRDTKNLTYEWDFGDGYTSSTQGDITHVYAWNGVFTVNLTISSDTGTPVESKPEYVTVSTDNSATGFTVGPKYVDFYVKTFWGSPIRNATVVVTPVSTSSGSFDWLISMLGLPTGGFNPNSTVMTQTTDIQGRTTFFVLPTAKYDINITAAGYTFDDGEMVPSDSQYTFKANLLQTDIFTHGYNEIEVIKFFTNGTELNTTHGRVYVAYNDTIGQTTSATVYVNRSTSVGNLTTETTIASYAHGSGNFTYNFDLAGTRGNSYIVRLTSTGTTFGTIHRDYGVTFKPGPKNLGIPEELLVYAGMLGLIFVGLCFTKIAGGPGPAVIVVMFFAWIFYLLGWWRDLAPEWIVVGALTFWTAVAILFNIMIRKNKSYAN